jgi:PAS domain S-box-containing protein
MFSVASPESGETIRNREVRYRRPDGKIFDLILNAGPLVGKENKVLGSLISLLDITERKRAESVLQSTLQRFYLMLASMYSGVLLMTDEGRVEFVNQAFCDSYGLKEAPVDLVGLASGDLLERIRHAYLHPDQATARVREILQRGQPVRGEEFAMQGGRTALRDFVPLSVDGKSSGRLWIHVDITERKRAEERLRDSENRFREMAETVPEILFTALPDGSMDYVNERGLDYAGLPAGEAVGDGWMKVVHPQDIEQSVRSVGESLRTGQPYELKQRLRAADGSYRWFLARARAVRDEKGNILKWFGSATDIHDMMQVEEALQASEARFRTLAEEMPHFVWETDADGKVLFANKRFYDFTGLTYEQAKAGGWLAVQHPDDAPAVEAAWLAALKGLGDYDVESRIRNRSTGEYRWFRIKGSPVTDSSGRIIRWVGTCTDINDVKQAEESMRIANESLEQRVRERTMDLQNLAKKLELSRGELRKLASELVMAEERERKRIAGVLHDEIAQTLAAARMRADMIRGIPSDQEERMKETKALLAQSIRETRSLMNDLGTPLLFDMGLQAACESLADRLMRIHPVRIRCDIGDAYKGLDPDVKIILYQLIRELLNNIVKHSQAQNALVAIDTENGMFRVKVTDDGVGFDPEVLGAPTAEGGFGLYSIRERLIAVDGTLRIESAPGAGTTVTAIVPSKMN